ncbi:MAG: sugar ABC transporter substrate-binding protein, partial [Actinobacteria bacterium]|nr:sugar ABC transporter substrate-binding protein [Actinomycetota bacterium]
MSATGAESAASIAKAGLAELAKGVYSTGPNGEQATAASSLTFTQDELAKLKKMNATAAISFHLTSDWTSGQQAGLTKRFKQLGIKVVGVTQADFKADVQVSQIQTLMAKKPNILVSIPVDGKATSAAYKAAAAAGTKIVFMDNTAADLQVGKDCVSVVSADNYANGAASAYLLGRELNGTGTIALIYHAADFWVTKQRWNGFKDTITKKFPGITIVEEQGISGPDFAGDAQKAATAILTKNPKLSAIWAVWDTPAEGVMAALRDAGNTTTKIATQDLGANVAISLAKKGQVIGLGAQRPFDAGVTEANLAAYALLGKKAP